MELTLKTYLTVCPLIFFAGFVDAIAGGGGLISLPAYIMAGVPVHLAQGTNKLVASFQVATAARQYWKSGYIRVRPAVFAAAGSLIGGMAGARLILMLSPEATQLIVMLCLPAAALLVLANKKIGRGDNIVEPKKECPRAFFLGLAVGVYDGAIGPGGGTFLILLLCAALGYSMITASANAKIGNLASCAGALVSYALGGKVSVALGLPCIFCACAGSYLGSKMAIKKGVKFIRPVMMGVMAMIFIKIVYDFAAGA